jgi:Effector Associated Constant Component 1
VEVVVGVAGTADEVQSLRRWLAAEEEFRGRVRPVEVPAPPEVLGPSLTELLVDVAGPGGVALAAALVAWARSRRGGCRPDRAAAGEETTVRFSARRVRGLEMDGLAAEIERLGRAVDALARPDGAISPTGGEAEGKAAGELGRRE